MKKKIKQKQKSVKALTKVDSFSKDTKIFFSFAKTFHAVHSYYTFFFYKHDVYKHIQAQVW